MSKIKALIAIPVLNERQNLPELLSKLEQWRESVLLVDDGSSDGTVDIIRATGFRCHCRETNEGLTGFYRTARNFALSSGYSHVIAMDGDGQHDPAFIPEYMEALRTYDLVSGNRFSSTTGIPLSKIASNLFAVLLFRHFLGVHLPDVACGFRGILAKSIPDAESQSRFEIIYGMLASHALEGKEIFFVPMPAVYFPDRPLFTKCSEITGLINAVKKYNPAPQLGAVIQALESGRDFRFDIGEITFTARLKQQGAYVFDPLPPEAGRLFNASHHTKK